MAVRPTGGFIRKPRYFQNVDKASESQPFLGGVVTDRYPWELSPNESPFLQDVIWPKGVPCQRGNWGRVGVASLFGNANPLAGVMAVQLAADGSIDLVVTNTVGAIGLATSGRSGVAAIGAGVALPSGVRVPRAVYHGEVLIPSLDGTTPIVRWMLKTGALTTPSGTIAFVDGSGVVVGTSTTMTTMSPAKTYISSDGIPIYSQRVATVESTVRLGLADAAIYDSFTGLNNNYQASPVGFIGLLSKVTDVGAVGLPASPSSNAIGKGTSWATAIPGSGQVGLLANVDWMILPAYAEPGAAPVSANLKFQRKIISVVVSDTTCIFDTPSGGVTVDQPYVVGRQLVGRDVCVHLGSVFACSPDWAKRRVYMLPPGAILSNETNQVDAKYTGTDRLAKWVDVPAPDTPGRVEAILSGGDIGGPLLALATEAAYGVWTSYPPSPSNTTIRLIGPGLGCNDLRSAVSSEYGQFWAGDEHIAAYRKGQTLSLTEGRRGREWRVLMKAKSATAIIVGWVVNGHLFIALNDASGPQSVTWCYDLVRDVWCGNISGLSPRAAHSARPLGFPQEAYVVTNETASQQVGAVGSVALDEGAANGSNAGAFIAETPSNIGGDPTLLKRVTDLKFGYELVGGGATITVKSSDGFAAPGTEVALPAGSAGQFITQRVRPITDVTQAPTGYLGRQVRQFKVRLEGAGSPSALRVHEMNVETRYQGPRS